MKQKINNFVDSHHILIGYPNTNALGETIPHYDFLKTDPYWRVLMDGQAND